MHPSNCKPVIIDNGDTFCGFCDMNQTVFKGDDCLCARDNPISITEDMYEMKSSARKRYDSNKNVFDKDQQSTSNNSFLSHLSNLGDPVKDIIDGNFSCLVVLDIFSPVNKYPR